MGIQSTRPAHGGPPTLILEATRDDIVIIHDNVHF